MKIRLMLILALAPWGGAPSASDGRSPALQAEVTVTSDYLFRGYSQSEGDPVLQAGLRYRHASGFFVGGWASTVRFAYDDMIGDPRRAEIRGSTGYARPVGQNWFWNALLVRYEFPGSDDRLDTSYTEAQVSAQYRELISTTIAYGPRYLGRDGAGLFGEVTAGYPLPFNLDLSVGIGYAELDPSRANHFYGHAELGRTFGPISVNVGYYDSDGIPIPPWGELVDGRWVLGITAQFP